MPTHAGLNMDMRDIYGIFAQFQMLMNVLFYIFKRMAAAYGAGVELAFNLFGRPH